MYILVYNMYALTNHAKMHLRIRKVYKNTKRTKRIVFSRYHDGLVILEKYPSNSNEGKEVSAGSFQRVVLKLSRALS
jgi:hypothetical protein